MQNGAPLAPMQITRLDLMQDKSIGWQKRLSSLQIILNNALSSGEADEQDIPVLQGEELKDETVYLILINNPHHQMH